METWKPIAAADGYEVSDHGRVRSWRRWGGRFITPGLATTPRLLSLKTDRDGYSIASLSIGGRLRYIRVHRLVALAFIGEPPAGKNEVRHLDGDPTNNAPGNLAWGDTAENAMDKVAHGRSTKGRVCPFAKLTDESAREVRTLRAGGLTYKQIAASVGVSPSVVARVARGEKWRHVTPVGG